MILVTGSKGFIGRTLTDNLRSQGKPVFEIDLKYHDVFNRLREVPWDKVEMIYHMGAITDTTCKSVERLYDFNVRFSIELMATAYDFNIPVHYASSASVYGNSDQWEVSPENDYAMSKAWVDLWVQNRLRENPYNAEHLLKLNKFTGFRFYNVYGIYENKFEQDSMVWKFIRQASADNDIKIFKNSDHVKRDFVCVDDVVQILQGTYDYGIYDVGTGHPMSVQSLAKAVAQKFFASVSEIPFPEELEGKYQYFTMAQPHIKYPYRSVQSWLDQLYP